LAAAHFQQGDRPAAWKAAENGMALIEQFASPTSYYMLGGYSGVAGAYLGLAETGYGECRVVASRVRRACRALLCYARIFPVGSPAAYLCKGRAAWLFGDRKAAMKAWHQCIRVADAMKMPYEQALGQLEIGQHPSFGDAQRQVHLIRACELFASVDACFDLSRARQCLPVSG
jgi:hypothetical protein